MKPTPLDRYDWGYCRHCFTEVILKPRSNKDIGDLIMEWHTGRGGVMCEGSCGRPSANPGGEVKKAAFQDPSQLPTIPCEVH